MPHFDLFFKTEELRRRLEPHLSLIPPFFQFTVRTGTPEVRYFDPKDPMWKGFPFPVPDKTVYVFDDDIPARALGGGMQNRASVRVTPRDTDDDAVILRIWHEILHAVGQPADDMARRAGEWQSVSERLIWAAWQSLSRPMDVPFWHRKFYVWLTERAASGAGGR
ncbi:hypothetical protein F8E02_01585 [Methanoculleus sp. Wushi-C6]|uniref:Uncharacterized protein n=1 Tax=Methanoculleus caldifontis TaxID=2651577 RepID=A0ABU3WY38_9EURY|nr:hypothetical protein [Methanoculleus sp. Wushi-C6]MDV2480717.1 hypothetical protein [Methanoculleus sp. Wushi-C6]